MYIPWLSVLFYVLKYDPNHLWDYAMRVALFNTISYILYSLLTMCRKSLLPRLWQYVKRSSTKRTTPLSSYQGARTSERFTIQDHFRPFDVHVYEAGSNDKLIYKMYIRPSSKWQ
ncbi:hypothetical protein ACI68E_001895 [Malassezia pachydermatis]